jgi:hypothetical protein
MRKTLRLLCVRLATFSAAQYAWYLIFEQLPLASRKISIDGTSRPSIEHGKVCQPE